MIRNSLVAMLLAAGVATVAHSATSAGRAPAGNLPAAQTTAVSTMPVPHATRMKFHGAVVNQSSNFITVRNLDPDHQNELRTFTFAPELRPKMQSILDAGGYQNGDRVVVTFLAGSSVALNVRGRPSKAA